MEALWQKALHDKAKITQTHTYIFRGQLQISDMFEHFLAVHNSSIGDLVTN